MVELTPSSRFTRQHFDYTNDAWTIFVFKREDDGEYGVWRYVDCGHPEAGTVMGAGSPEPGGIFQGCECYGKAHQGEEVPEEIVKEMWKREKERYERSYIISDAARNAHHVHQLDREDCEGGSGLEDIYW